VLVEEASVVEDVDRTVLDDCATELLILVVELALLAELEEEVGVVFPPDDGGDTK